MRVDAINSFISSTPMIDFFPVPGIVRGEDHVMESHERPATAATYTHVRLDVDSWAPAPALALDFIPVTKAMTSKLSPAERSYCDAIIARGRRSGDLSGAIRV